MSDTCENFDDRKHFFKWVYIELLTKLPHIGQILLSHNIEDELFTRALEIGYDKRQAKIVREVISEYYMRQDYHPIKAETLENNYCETALAQILQERINNSEVFKEDIELLDQLLSRYDPIASDEHLKPVPNDVLIPEFEPKTWIENIGCEVPERLDSSDWVTLYSSIEFRLRGFDKVGIETEKIATLLIPTKNVIHYRSDFGKLTIDDIIRYVSHCKTIRAFKKLPSLLNYDEFSVPLIVSYNNWRLHHSSILVRLDQFFLEQNGLKWDKKSILNLMLNDSTVVQYNLWAGPFDGEDYSRDRIASGVKLQIKKDFLKRYLKTKGMSVLMINEKERLLARPGIHNTDIEDSTKLKKCTLYSDMLVVVDQAQA